MSDGLVGKSIGGYNVEAIIGSGSFSTVYRGRHEHLDDIVAIKIMSQRVLNPETYEVFIKEQKLTMSLDHENIVKTLNVGTIENTKTEHDGYPYIVMEFMSNGNLRNRIEKKSIEGLEIHPMDEISVLQMAIECLDAMDYTHNHEGQVVLHRDIHPGNILFDEGWVSHIGDFGLAKAKESNSGVSDSLFSKQTIGLSGRYRPPSDVLSGIIDCRYDIYALGCTLQFAVFGVESPYLIDNNLRGVYLNNEYKEVILELISASQNIYPIIEKALQPFKEDRWDNADQMRQAVISSKEKSIYDLNKDRYLDIFEAINSNQGLLNPNQIYDLQRILSEAEEEKYRHEGIFERMKQSYMERENSDTDSIIGEIRAIKHTTDKKIRKRTNQRLDDFYDIAHAYARHPADDMSCLDDLLEG